MRRLSLLALSGVLLAGPAFAVPTPPSDHGLFDGGAFPPQAGGIVTYVDLGNALDGYVTQISLTSTLSAYLTTSEAQSTYLSRRGGTMSGAISAGNLQGSQAGYYLSPYVFEGQFNAPDTNLVQGSAMAWNSLTGAGGSGSFGETDFYNLQGLGSGGFSFCTGTTAAGCKNNVLMTISGAGVSFSRGAKINGDVSISGAAILSGATGSGNAFACFNSNGQVYRSSTACQ